MSKTKNAPGKFAAKKKKSGKGKWILLILLLVLAAGIAWALMSPGGSDEMTDATAAAVQTEMAPGESEEVESPVSQQGAVSEENYVDFEYGISISDIGGYTGMFMEDGSDEILSDILMLVVSNDGEQDIQYAKITMDIGGKTALFELTTLPAGEKMVLLEKNRMTFDQNVDYSAILPKVENVAYFQAPLSLREDKLQIGILDGAINVTNISGEDITGNIAIHYKNAAEDLYYGGITYRITVEGGLKAGEIRQVMTNHASDTGSRILFVTIANEQ